MINEEDIRKERIADDLIEKTKKTAALYFKDVTDERPYGLWRSFDKEMAKDLSLFITGKWMVLIFFKILT